MRLVEHGIFSFSRLEVSGRGLWKPVHVCAVVCSSRDTVTTYKGLVQAKRITYAFWIRDRPLPRRPTWRFASPVRGTNCTCILRTFYTACQIIVSKSSTTFPRNLYYRAPNTRQRTNERTNHFGGNENVDRFVSWGFYL